MTMKWIALAATAAALTGCAGGDGAGTAGTSTLTTGQCFRGPDVNNFNVRDEKTLYVLTRQGYVFRVDAPQGCFATGTESVSLTPFTGADPNICVGDQANVRVGRFRSPPLPCVARVSGPITDSSVSGLRGRSG